MPYVSFSRASRLTRESSTPERLGYYMDADRCGPFALAAALSAQGFPCTGEKIQLVLKGEIQLNPNEIEAAAKALGIKSGQLLPGGP